MFNHCYLLFWRSFKFRVMVMVLRLPAIECQFYPKKFTYSISHAYDEKGIVIPVLPIRKAQRR